jgi:hypothetical protein
MRLAFPFLPKETFWGCFKFKIRYCYVHTFLMGFFVKYMPLIKKLPSLSEEKSG